MFSTQLIGKSIFDQNAFGIDQDELQQLFLISDWRFNNVSDRDLMQVQVIGVSTSLGVTDWIQSIKVESHLCTHDDQDVKDCRTTQYVVFER